jgi:hypothetical protein
VYEVADDGDATITITADKTAPMTPIRADKRMDTPFPVKKWTQRDEGDTVLEEATSRTASVWSKRGPPR